MTDDTSAAVNRREFGRRMGALVVGATFATSEVSRRMPTDRTTYSQVNMKLPAEVAGIHCSIPGHDYSSSTRTTYDEIDKATAYFHNISHKISSKCELVAECLKPLFSTGVGAIFAIGLAIGLATPVFAQTDIYILAGQSNMTGVAPLAGEPTPQNQSRLMAYTWKGNWEQAKDPLSGYAGAGVGPGLWFADRMATLCPGNTIGVVMCARGAHFFQSGCRTIPHTAFMATC